MNVNVPTLQCLDHMWVDIHANDLKSMRGKGGGCGESDISQPKYTNFLKVHECSCRAYYKALGCNHFHNFGVMNFVDTIGIKELSCCIMNWRSYGIPI